MTTYDWVILACLVIASVCNILNYHYSRKSKRLMEEYLCAVASAENDRRAKEASDANA
jgi:hypothetical protein